MIWACKHRVQKQWFWVVVSNFSEIDHRKTRCFQHRGVKTRGVLTTCFPDLSTLPTIFNTFFYWFDNIFFIFFTAFDSIFFCKKILCSSTEYVQSGRKKVNLHAHLYLIPAWCVRKKICIPALTASLSSNPSPPKNAHGMCSSTAYVHFHCVRARVLLNIS